MATAVRHDVSGGNPALVEQPTHQRQAMLHSFTKATTGAIVGMVVLLVGMAVFLL